MSVVTVGATSGLADRPETRALPAGCRAGSAVGGRTVFEPAPAASSAAAPIAVAFTPSPPPSTAPLTATDPPPGEKTARDGGSGTAALPLSAARCARNRRATNAHSGHARRCARSPALSPRVSIPSSCREIARSTSPQSNAPSSCSRNARRARKISVSTALTEMPRTSAISVYERPSSSRMTRAARWLSPSCERARRTSSRQGPPSSSSAGRAAISGSIITSLGRRAASRKRCLQTLWAIAISQLSGRSGR